MRSMYSRFQAGCLREIGEIEKGPIDAKIALLSIQ